MYYNVFIDKKLLKLKIWASSLATVILKQDTRVYIIVQKQK